MSKEDSAADNESSYSDYWIDIAIPPHAQIGMNSPFV
jgi:hypothetical protein